MLIVSCSCLCVVSSVLSPVIMSHKSQRGKLCNGVSNHDLFIVCMIKMETGQEPMERYMLHVPLRSDNIGLKKKSRNQSVTGHSLLHMHVYMYVCTYIALIHHYYYSFYVRNMSNKSMASPLYCGMQHAL